MRNAKGQFVKGSGFWTGKKRPGLNLNGERQRALAKEFGISQSAVSCIVRGKSANGNRNYYA